MTEETVPAFPRGDKGEAEDGGIEDRSGGRTAGEIMLERPGRMTRETEDGGTGDRSGGRTAEEIALEQPGIAAGELWKDGPVWTVRGGSPEMDETQRFATAEQAAQAEEALQTTRDGELIWAGLERAVWGGTTSPALEGVGRSGLAQAGLEGLYRRTVQGLRPAAPSLPPEQAGRTARAQEPGSAASLAVDELDRAVRRDSRRYDGGMSIY